MDAVQPRQLLVVEDGRARRDALEREELQQLVAREDLRLVVVGPAEPREEVDERLRDVALLAEVLDRLRAVALGELLAVAAEDVGGVRVDGRLVAERAENLDLLRSVRDVVLAADHMRDLVEHVVDRRGEVVGRAAVGAQDHEVVEVLVLHLDPAADDVVPAGRALVGHAEADRALVLVRLALVDELPAEALRVLHPVELEADRSVPVDPEPGERALDLLGRLGHLAARVRVLDPQEGLAALRSGEQPVEEERADAPDVEQAGGARSHADADGRSHGTIVGACSSAAMSPAV